MPISQASSFATDLDTSDRRIEDLIQVGHVITGRITKINFEDIFKFSVQLNCTRKNLESHEQYA